MHRIRSLLSACRRFIGTGAIIALAGWIAHALAGLASGGRPAAPLGAAIADGLDELFIRAQSVLGFIDIQPSSVAGAAAVMSTVCLAWALADTVSVIRSRVSGPNDAAAFCTYVARRIIGVLRPKQRDVVWGRVYDVHKLEPVPFAVVTLMDESGPLAYAVSDTYGRYGFRSPRTRLAAEGLAASLAVQKDGYLLAPPPYQHDDRLLTGADRLLLSHSDTAGMLHLGLRQSSEHNRIPLVPAHSASLALLGAIVFAPIVLIAAPGILTGALVVAVIVTGLLHGSLRGLTWTQNAEPSDL